MVPSNKPVREDLAKQLAWDAELMERRRALAAKLKSDDWDRFGSGFICPSCHALVLPEARAGHRAWHGPPDEF